jgi:hypothetical protein
VSRSFFFKAPLPFAALSSNSRKSWRAQLRFKKWGRVEGELHAAATFKDFKRLFGDEPAPPVCLSVEAVPAMRNLSQDRHCPSDPSNGVASLKAFQDGLAIGWKVDDLRFNVIWKKRPRTKDDPPSGTLKITVSRWSSTFDSEAAGE